MISDTTVERMKDIVHYVISNDKKQELGAIKLNKVLWFSDLYFFIEHGKSLSGQDDYTKQKFGPVVRNMPAILADLKQEGRISVEEKQNFTHRRAIYKSLKNCQIDLSKEEQRILDGVLQEICNNFTASEVSEATHNIIWDAAKLGESIPLYTVFASRPGLVTNKQIEWAKSCIASS